MRKKNFKGRCEKRSLDKFTTICKTYDPIQTAYANILVENKDISEVRCNVILDGDCGEYMSEIVDSDALDPGCFGCSAHFPVQTVLCDGEDPVGRMYSIQHFQISQYFALSIIA